ncbi:thioesterase [Streptomyces cellostaticus]|uniref:Medium/long-chain acyl-CoA thioesterase YigI n=1 Tax=Streptomyces cellostaticus TaxID=67285 RepID=A0A117PTS0_9ACTN|nr:PaaI family thioesterase [Streptomyces cellostaticus]KUM91310.1 thioesterase [Streptomyces cellostaticus]
MTDTLDLESAREALAAQPFSVLLGTRLVAFGAGAATLELDIREELLQQHGFLHGGVLGYAADNALTFAAGAVLGPRVVTAGFTIDYLRPATGTLLHAEAHVVRAGRTRAVCRCDVSAIAADGTPRLCAVAQGTVSVAGHAQSWTGRPLQPSKDARWTHS